MSSHQPIKIVDLFAGPGGLGEGFSSYNDGRSFEIMVSAEMDPAAHSTLRLRAFYRALKKHNPAALEDYYEFCNSDGMVASDLRRGRREWSLAEHEAQRIELGTADGNRRLDELLVGLDGEKPWVLIGGPPCQAYSLVGRARNRGKSDYRAEDDHRHFLYREYLRIIQKKRPAVFVMENVKGILSSKVGGEAIFPRILQDLADPDKALGERSSGPKYRICSLVADDIYETGAGPGSIDPGNFIIRAENYGIPQARHRVILLGVSEEFAGALGDHRLNPASEPGPFIEDVIGDLPRLRSTLTRVKDNPDAWAREVLGHLDELHRALLASNKTDPALAFNLEIVRNSFSGGHLPSGRLRMRKMYDLGKTGNQDLDRWYLDNRLDVWLNHEARGHMSSDLRRYVYASVFAKVKGYSPKGHQEFDLPGLAPDHKNWESGKFSDRFRVQMEGAPSTTITSHISKDGHYFIHYDPNQCRSLTVREAARLQTFPDNYFFLGNRTQQFHQVGNAVPPLLARQIAEVVDRIINNRAGNHIQEVYRQGLLFPTVCLESPPG
ncbi:DNA cytosine methyltransferase [Azotobacter chroococcum]|uniref:DNA cytosine methyltransferase n=1 Tax=Azotobacter chroococcum TaxID=353 RepID=UPI001038B796|nr:DNA cytosine methyltransferase [Azotobacter chroococcum]TBW08432.1 DNA cytosine methyltransferase [Azotobacter chroococcum]